MDSSMPATPEPHDASPEAGLVDLADVQSIVVFRRPAPYWGSLIFLHVADAAGGRRSLAHFLPQVMTAAGWAAGERDLSVTIALTHAGLAALGVPPETLASFPEQLRDGMAARAHRLGDTGESAPAHWDAPFGNGSIHVVVAVTASSEQLWRERVTAALGELVQNGVMLLSHQHVAAHPATRTAFGYRDGISFPHVAGLPAGPITTPEPPLATGEFLLGYPGEHGAPLAMPWPPALGHNGTYVGIRKIHSRVAAFRRFLRANASGEAEEELLAAKLLGRWRSGAPLALAPEADDPALAADPERVNAFTYAGDPRGLRCPHGAHIRRLNPRDSELETLTDVRVHRILRHGAVYGDPLPPGVLDDDGADRGIYFMFMSARPGALEFLKREWMDSGGFVGLGDEMDPIAGANDGGGTFTIPQQPVRRRVHGLERFCTTRGGEYAFVPSLTALRWLSAGPTRH